MSDALMPSLLITHRSPGESRDPPWNRLDVLRLFAGQRAARNRVCWDDWRVDTAYCGT